MAASNQICMRWTIRNHIISELEINGQNVIRPWGIETADSSAFFSSDTSVGYRYTIEHSDFESNDHLNASKMVTNMKDGRVEISSRDQLTNHDTIERSASLNPLSETWLMDFVIRYRFKKDCIKYAEINGRRYEHHGSNVYHQFPVNNVFLRGVGFNASIRVTQMRIPTSFAQFMYVRDAKDEWIVHVRLLPRIWDREVIKLSNFWYRTRSLPQIISRPLLQIRAVRNALWYRGERAPYRNKMVKLINPIAYPLIKLQKNDSIFLKSTCSFNIENII